MCGSLIVTNSNVHFVHKELIQPEADHPRGETSGMTRRNNMNKSKHFLILNYEYPPVGGGGGIATKIFAEELASSGHNVTVLTTHMKGLKLQENINSVSVYRTPVLLRTSLSKASFLSLITWPISSTLFGIWLCSKNKFDLINTHFILPTGLTGYFLSKLFNLKNILYVHGADIYDPERMEMTPSGNGFFSKILRSLAQDLLKNANGILCQSNDTYSRIASLFPALKEKIQIIPLPFKKPIQEFQRVFKKRENSLKLISIGRLVKRKGYKYLLEAISLLPKYYNVELSIIGEGPLKNELIVLAKNLDLLDKVKFKGHIHDDEKYKLLAESDVYVLSSLHEGMGIVLQEAMFAGLPIISTNIGGQNDLLEDNINAVMVAPENSEALKDAIIKLYENNGLMEKFSKNNKEKIQNYYSDKIGKKFEEYLLSYT